MGPELELYCSYRQIEQWDEARVRSLRAAVVGTGSLGSELIEQLAAMGVGTIVAVDYDELQPHNILRTSLVSPKGVGRIKVAAVADGARARFGDSVRIIPLNGWVETTVGVGLAARLDMAFLCADNRAARLYGCRTFREAGKPHISGAIDGFMGLVDGVFDPPKTACYECTLNERERQLLLPVQSSCSAQPEEGVSVPTTPIAASITAGFMVMAVLQHISGNEAALGRRVFVNPELRTVDVATYSPRSGCGCRSRQARPGPLSLQSGRESTRPLDLIRDARPALGDARVILDYSLVTADTCASCGANRTLEAPRHQAVHGRCRQCGARTTPLSWTSIIDENHPFAELTFGQLGLPLLQPVAVQGRDIRVYELAGDAAAIGLEERI